MTTSLFLARNYSQAGRLEVENARKTAEIESARALQVSMLPRALPAVEGLETAAALVTASEVGGDYYDFRVAPDGSLVVAVGDATRHGVAAGIMVTAVKALFSALGESGSWSRAPSCSARRPGRTKAAASTTTSLHAAGAADVLSLVHQWRGRLRHAEGDVE